MRWGKQTATFLSRLSHDALSADDEVLEEWSRVLMALSSADLLLLDHYARAASYWSLPIVADEEAWGGRELDEPTAVRATVASWHRNGFIRERATVVLSRATTPLATRALAVRAMDPVLPVRELARSAIVGAVDSAGSPGVIDVLATADRGRIGTDARVWAEKWISDMPHPGATVDALLASQRREARRWALAWGAERGFIPRERLVEIAMHDADQWMPPKAAAYVLGADPGLASTLSRSRSASVRLLTTVTAADEVMTSSWFEASCADPSARVRSLARERARRRGFDLDTVDAKALKEGIPQRSVVAALSEVSRQSPEAMIARVAPFLGHPVAAVRASAALAVERAWPLNLASPSLAALLEDESARVARTAARALGRLRAPAALANHAWDASSAASRKYAWHFVSQLGAWDVLEGHLRALSDTDPDVKDLGVMGLQVWVRDVAPHAWTPLPEAQRARILHLLGTSALTDAFAQRIEFCLRTASA